MSSNPLKPIQATPRKDVFDRGLDDYAVNLADVFLKTDKQGIFSNPKKFFDITFITPTHITILSSIVTAFKKNRAGKIIILPSTFGGGKSHTLTLIYHTQRPLA